MNGAELALDVAMLLLGGTGVFEGLLRLASSPLEAVLIILSAMFFLLFPAASLCGTAVLYIGSRRKWKSYYTHRGGSFASTIRRNECQIQEQPPESCHSLKSSFVSALV
jgi:hypothetical protein